MRLFEIAMLQKMNGKGGGGGSGSGIIDVTELPTENIVENAPYRVTQQSVELYLCGVAEEPIPYLEMLRAEGATITVEIVETLPETLTPCDTENKILALYIVESTGIVYGDFGGGAMSFGQAMSGNEGMDKGWSSDINAETEQGIYTCEVVEITLNTYTDGKWKVYKDADKVLALEEEVATLESENSSLNSQVSSLESNNSSLQSQVSTLKSEKTTLQNENSSLQNQVETLESENNTLTDQVEELTPAIPAANFTKFATFVGTDNNGVLMTSVTDKTIKSITVSDCVTNISGGALSGCGNLESVILPFLGDTVKAATDKFQYPFGFIFGANSYDGGTGISQSYYGSSTVNIESTNYCIPASLKSVTITGGNVVCGAFSNCSNLKKIVLPDSATSIGNYAFWKCRALTDIIIPDNVTSIGVEAFVYCAFTTINIPSGVTSIGEKAFDFCSKLTSITYSGTKEQWKAITKGTNWDGNTPDYTITCTDGTIAKDGTET